MFHISELIPALPPSCAAYAGSHSLDLGDDRNDVKSRLSDVWKPNLMGQGHVCNISCMTAFCSRSPLLMSHCLLVGYPILWSLQLLRLNVYSPCKICNHVLVAIHRVDAKFSDLKDPHSCIKSLVGLNCVIYTEETLDACRSRGKIGGRQLR